MFRVFVLEQDTKHLFKKYLNINLNIINKLSKSLYYMKKGMVQ